MIEMGAVNMIGKESIEVKEPCRFELVEHVVTVIKHARLKIN